MSGAARRAEFFALEAGEYLADLGPLAAARDLPDAERLVRGARALRGAALMAGLGTFARAAAALEGLARQVRDHALPWEPEVHEGWRDGLAVLRGLTPRAVTWGADEDREALALADRLERITGGGTIPPVTPPAPGLSAGVRAFIARESALIAGSLEAAARALAPVPPAAALSAVLERMQSLRGLGASAELSPLPELLSAMEIATQTLLAEEVPPADMGAIFSDAAQALGAMARTIGEGGRVIAPPAIDSLAMRLLRSCTQDDDAVAITALAPGGGDAIITRGTPIDALPDQGPLPLELVSVGDHLLTVAGMLGGGVLPAARDLRLFALHRTLAAMPPRSGTGRFLAPLVRTITSAISHGGAAARPDAFIALLTDAGRFLVAAGGGDDVETLRDRRDRIAAAFEPAEVAPRPALAAPVDPVVPIAALAPEADPEPVVSIASLAPDAGDDVIPIEALAPDEDDDVVAIEALAPEAEDDVIAIERLAPDADAPDDLTGTPIVSILSLAPDVPEAADGAPGRLERAFGRRATLERAAPAAAASLDGLIAAEIVAVESLLLRGGAALRRADQVRAEIDAILAEPAVSLDRLRPHLLELLDLVALARDAA